MERAFTKRMWSAANQTLIKADCVSFLEQDRSTVILSMGDGRNGVLVLRIQNDLGLPKDVVHVGVAS